MASFLGRLGGVFRKMADRLDGAESPAPPVTTGTPGVAGAEVGHGPPPGHSERRQHPRTSVEGLRVLIVDDSPTILALLRKMLTQNKIDVIEAADAERGLELAYADPPDVVFLDIVLPGMSGFVALRALKRDPRTRHVPIIMMSGNAQATEEFYVQRIGAEDFMKKPFSRAEVFARVTKAVGLPPHVEHGRPVAH